MKTLLNLSKLRSVILIAMWVLLCTSEAWAVQQVSGYVRATDIVDTYVELTGNTTLTVNKTLYLRRLYGESEEPFVFRSSDGRVRVTVQPSVVTGNGEAGVILSWRADAE